MDVAAHVVGFVKDDGSGAAGVEARFENRLPGVKGRSWSRSMHPQSGSVFTRIEREPVPGASIELTIDTRLQQIANANLPRAFGRRAPRRRL
jgi:cell division protein FtsI/penicillin-binding protein 2